MSDRLMTVAFAKALGVKPTQVKYWTDLGALRCVPGTKGAGQGNKRLYAADYLPEAALIAEIAKYKIPADSLVHWSKEIATLLDHGEPKRFLHRKPAQWYRHAIAGKHESHIVFGTPIMAARKAIEKLDGKLGDNFGWNGPELISDYPKIFSSLIMINVKAVVQPYLQ